MLLFWYAALFLFGAIIGSFLNVVIYRFNTGKSLNGRSHCMSCGNILAWHDLFPVFSYVWLRGKCRQCEAHIPSRYALVEIATGALFVAHAYVFQYDLGILLFALIATSFLVVIFVYDLRHMIIPDTLVAGLSIVAALAVLYEALQGFGATAFILHHALAGALAALFFASFWFFSKGRWMGLGDAKLAFPLGLFAGPLGIIAVIMLAFWIGAIVSLTIVVLQKMMQKGKTHLVFLQTPLKMKSEIPFAPFLIIAFWCVTLLHVDIFTLINFFTF